MARVEIVIPSLIRNPGATGSVRQDPNMLSGANAALVRLGESAQNVALNGADAVGSFNQRKQALVDQGVLSNEETERMKTASNIQSQIAAAPGDPSSWQKITDAGWKQYGDERQLRQEKGQWGPKVQAEDQSRFNNYKVQVNGSIQVQTSKAQVAVANSQIEAYAQSLLAAGQLEGYESEMRKLNIFEGDKSMAIRRGLDSGFHKKADAEVEKLKTLAPANQVQALDEYVKQLNQKDENGSYQSYKYGDKGELSESGRDSLTDKANSIRFAATNKMAGNASDLVTELRTNRSSIADLAVMLNKGDISVEIARAFSPKFTEAMAEGDEKQANKDRILQDREDAEAQKLLTEARSQAGAAAALTEDISGKTGKGEADVQTIDQRVALGKITKERGDQIKTQLALAASAEMASPSGDFARISKEIDSAYASKMWFHTGATDEQYNALLDKVSAAKLTKPSRMELLDKIFKVKLADIEDLEEEGVQSRWGNRDISMDERELRKGLLGQYKKLLGSLSVEGAGNIMLSQESRIRSFFDSAPNGRSAAEVSTLKTELSKQANDAAGHEALNKAFDF